MRLITAPSLRVPKSDIIVSDGAYNCGIRCTAFIPEESTVILVHQALPYFERTPNGLFFTILSTKVEVHTPASVSESISASNSVPILYNAAISTLFSPIIPLLPIVISTPSPEFFSCSDPSQSSQHMDRSLHSEQSRGGFSNNSQDLQYVGTLTSPRASMPEVSTDSAGRPEEICIETKFGTRITPDLITSTLCRFFPRAVASQIVTTANTFYSQHMDQISPITWHRSLAGYAAPLPMDNLDAYSTRTYREMLEEYVMENENHSGVCPTDMA